MNLSHQTEQLEDRLQSCIDHPFKKARYAWQIKGYVNSTNRQCLPMACSSDTENSGTSESPEEINNSENNLDCSTTAKHSGIGVESFTVEHGNAENIFQTSKEEGNDKSDSPSCQPTYDNHSFKRKSESPSAPHETNTRIKRIKVNSSESSMEALNGHLLELPNESPSDNTNSEDRDLSSYMWQKREMGFAIVDNVCNETLEVMGLSPDPKVNMQARARLALEDHSIETAIKNQGLFAISEKKSESEGDMDVFVDEPDHKDINDLGDGIIKNTELDSMMMSCKPDLLSRSSNGENHFNVPVDDSSDVCDFVNTKSGDYNPQCEPEKLCHYIDETISNSKHIPVCSESDSVCSAMDHSDSSETVAIKKSSDIVIDLAVSAAIITQGLSFQNTL